MSDSNILHWGPLTAPRQISLRALIAGMPKRDLAREAELIRLTREKVAELRKAADNG